MSDDTTPETTAESVLRNQKQLLDEQPEVEAPIRFEDALAEFRRVWTKWDLLGDLGEKLTCTECDALADFLDALGEHDAAKGLREAHAEGDDEGDSHFTGETEED